MTNNARSRHAAQGRASRIAGRAALGVLGAPIAMLAVAGPAGAATLDLDGVLVEDGLDIQLAANDVSVPSLDSFGLPALPTELPELPLDGFAFEGIALDLFDLAGDEGLALPALPAVDGVPALPVLPALPAVDSLPALDDLALPELALPTDDVLAVVPVGLPALPAVDDLALPELPALPTDDVLAVVPVGLPALPAVDDLALPSVDALPALPTATNLDLDDVTAVVPAADVFSATDLVSGLI